MAYEAAHNYCYETTRWPGQLSSAFLALTATGRQVGRAAYREALARVALAGQELRSITGGLDALIAPAAIGEAPLATSGTGDPVMSRMWTALQLPALAVPAGQGTAGLPLAVQLVAARGADDLLLQVGHWAGTTLELP